MPDVVSVISISEPVISVTVTPETPVGSTTAIEVSPATASLFAYHHVQGASDRVWGIRHSLGWYPNVTTMDSAGSIAHGELVHETVNRLRVTFSAPISGNAYLS